MDIVPDPHDFRKWFSARQAARAILCEMSRQDLGELRRVIGEAEFRVAYEVAGLEGAAFGRLGEVRR